MVYKKPGQVTVELLLVLPVFMLILFFIMEIGNLAHKTILAHHYAYELARIGSLTAIPEGVSTGFSCSSQNAAFGMKGALDRMISASGVALTAVPECMNDSKLVDPQSGQENMDLEVTVTYPVKLIFPGSGYVLADVPKSRGIRKIHAAVRMPVEKPLRQ